MKKIFVIIAILALVILAGAGAMLWRSGSGESGPPVLAVNFVDLDKVEKISKFRSCQGHIVIPQDESETMRNMKHYVVLKPEYQNKGGVPLYAPYAARVAGIFSMPDKGLEGEIWLDGGSEWQFSIEHIKLLDSIKVGDRLKAGELIGYAAKGFDIVYAVGAEETKIIHGYASPFSALDSPFAHMGAEAFAKYQAKGVAAPEDMIYSREYREQHPCRYREGDNEGGLNDFEHPEDWVFLK